MGIWAVIVRIRVERGSLVGGDSSLGRGNLLGSRDINVNNA